MPIKADRVGISNIAPREGHDSFLPASRKNSCRESNSLPVVAKGPVKHRSFANRSVHHVGLSLVVVIEEGEICLNRDRCLDRKLTLRKARQNCLAADDKDARVPRDVCGGPQKVGQIFTIHVREDFSEDLHASSTVILSASERTPANGVFCRSSLP